MRARPRPRWCRGDKDASLPWENPETGARGTVTPLAAAYTQDGSTCRDFLASYVRDGRGGLAAGRSLPRRRKRQMGASDSLTAAANAAP